MGFENEFKKAAQNGRLGGVWEYIIPDFSAQGSTPDNAARQLLKQALMENRGDIIQTLLERPAMTDVSDTYKESLFHGTSLDNYAGTGSLLERFKAEAHLKGEKVSDAATIGDRNKQPLIPAKNLKP